MIMSRIFSYLTTSSGRARDYYSTYGFINRKEFDNWRASYESIRTSINNGDNKFYEISKPSSARHGWVGKIKVNQLPSLCTRTNTIGEIQSIVYSIRGGNTKVDMDFGKKEISVPLNWLISTSHTDYVIVNQKDRKNKLDMLGTETKEGQYVIYRYDKEIILGIICKISEKSKAVYCRDFHGEREKRIDNPAGELIVIDKNTNMYGLMTKKKLTLM